jgi:nitrilase
MPTSKISAAHIAPVLLDRRKTLQRTIDVIQEAARNGAELVAFPESFIPGFPVWAAVQAPIHNHGFFAAMVSESIAIDGPEMMAVRSAARAGSIHVSLGFSETSPSSVGCIWNSNVLIGPDGTVLNHHRKLVPTFFEKMVWAPGDGHGLRVVNTAVGRLGMLICGENTNPLARYALIAQREQLHISTYPPLWPTHDLSSGLNYDLERAIHIRAGCHSFEGKVFNLVVSAVHDQKCQEALTTLDGTLRAIIEGTARGVSMVIGPRGEVVSEILRESEGILYCDIDLADCVPPKQFHDVAGYYNRFDVFDLRVNRARQAPVAFSQLPPVDKVPDLTKSDLDDFLSAGS